MQLNRGAEAIPDLKIYLEHDPNNVQALDQLGRALLKLNQPEAAAGYLERAITLKPEEGALYFQYSRALRALGRNKEVMEALAKFKQLGGDKEKVVPPPGFFDYLSLSPTEQQTQYIANLKRAIEQRPSEPDFKLRLAEAFFRQGRPADALPLLDQVRQLSSSPKTMSQAGRILLEARQYQAALPFLEIAVSGEGRPEEVLLDYILAVFQVNGADKALEKLSQYRPAQPGGNFYLLQAQLLDAQGKLPEAVDSLNLAFRAAPSRTDLYLEAALFLVKHARYAEALNLLEQSRKHIAPQAEMMLLEAIILELQNKNDEAVRKLAEIQSRWPEWHQAYLIHGIILQSQHRPGEAKQLLETAIALGGKDPVAYYYLSLAMKELNPENNQEAYQAVLQALALNPSDPYGQIQAGKLALALKDYAKAKTHLEEALRLSPEMADAYWTLASVYRATGEQEKQLKALAEVERLNQLHPPGGQELPLKDLLFGIGFPGKKGK
jgi:tetratricopeptide (TPR) repeat protein